MIGNVTTPKRLLTLILLSVFLAACRAEHTPPSLDPLTAATPAPPVLADAASATPQPIATSTTSPAASATVSTVTATPVPRRLHWCADGLITCFDEAHTFPLVRPIPIRIDPTYRYASTQGRLREIHRGVEFPSPSGTPVLAAARGQVIFAGDDMSEKVALWPEFYGNYIVIEHNIPGQPVYTLYAHLSEINVVTGQVISTGEEIGLVGASGSAIGSHLHFEVRQGQNTYFSTRNPELWLVPIESAGALAGRIYDPAGGQPRGTVRIQPMDNGKIAQSRPPLPMDIYPPELVAENGENFALNDLPAGEYRLTYLYNGKLYEHFVEILPGILTLISIVLD
jgi:murein DD-endopeptidase MepM/ murein hydrolase activator NlpD